MLTGRINLKGHYMPEESFDGNFTDVPLINQLTNMSCWAASAAMVVGWRDFLSIDPSEIASGTGVWSAYANGLAPEDIPTLANARGLTMEPPQSYTIDGLRNLVQSKGPLWVAADVPGLHAIVVTGVYSDGFGDYTFVRINDPWDRDPGTPGQVGAYFDTHDNGSQLCPDVAAVRAGVRNAGDIPECERPDPSRGRAVIKHEAKSFQRKVGLALGEDSREVYSGLGVITTYGVIRVKRATEKQRTGPSPEGCEQNTCYLNVL
jgi:hypothetical protein